MFEIFFQGKVASGNWGIVWNKKAWTEKQNRRRSGQKKPISKEALNKEYNMRTEKDEVVGLFRSDQSLHRRLRYKESDRNSSAVF